MVGFCKLKITFKNLKLLLFFMSDYFYSKNYLNSKFNCDLKKDLSKNSICDEIENETGDETNFVTITDLDIENQKITVVYKYWEFGESQEEQVSLNLEKCY